MGFKVPFLHVETRKEELVAIYCSRDNQQIFPNVFSSINPLCFRIKNVSIVFVCSKLRMRKAPKRN